MSVFRQNGNGRRRSTRPGLTQDFSLIHRKLFPSPVASRRVVFRDAHHSEGEDWVKLFLLSWQPTYNIPLRSYAVGSGEVVVVVVVHGWWGEPSQALHISIYTRWTPNCGGMPSSIIEGEFLPSLRKSIFGSQSQLEKVDWSAAAAVWDFAPSSSPTLSSLSMVPCGCLGNFVVWFINFKMPFNDARRVLSLQQVK